MNIKQIIDRLSAEFTGDTRKLVFWYDDNGEFVEDMQNVELDNAKVYFLQPDNHLEDTLLSFKRFHHGDSLCHLPHALQVCLDSGGKKVLLPIISAADLGAVPSELIGCFNLIFYQSAEDAVYKALGVE